MKILDCNLTYGAATNGKPYKNCDTFAGLLSALEAAGISGGLVKCRYSDTVGVNYGNEAVLREVEEARLKGWPLWPVWALLPPYTNETPAPQDLMEEIIAHKVGAVYLNPAVHRWVPSMLTLGDTFRLLEGVGVPVLLNTAAGVPMELIYRILQRFPRLTAIVSDADCWPNARRLYPLAYEYENVYLDLSYVMDAGGVEDMVSRFGAEKLLYGSAFPERYPGAALAAVRAADLGEKERAQIFGGNFERIVKRWED